MRTAFRFLTKFLPTQIVFAHCDIPCGIYDPHNLQMAAHTVLRMTRLLGDLKIPDEEKATDMDYTKHHNSVVRVIRVKEKHGEMIEDELGTLENDYFKPEHFEKFPELKKLIEEAVKLSIKTRQGVDEKLSEELLEKTLQIAEIFYKTKDLTPVRISSGYPTEGEIVTHR